MSELGAKKKTYRSNFEDGDTHRSGTPRAPMQPLLPERKSYSTIHKQSLKSNRNRNKTVAGGWTVSEYSLTPGESSGGGDSIGEQARGSTQSFNIDSAGKKKHAKASVSTHVGTGRGADIIKEASKDNDDDKSDTTYESLFSSFEFDNPTKKTNSSSIKSSKKTATITSKEQPSFKSVLLTSDDSSDDESIENVPSKPTTNNSDDHSTFEVTASINDISVLPVINTEYETNETHQLTGFNTNSIIEISSGTSSKLLDNSRKHKRITFKPDSVSIPSSSSDGMKRGISYGKSPHVKKLNQQPKTDQSSYFSFNTIDSEDFEVQRSEMFKEEVIDLTTPSKKSIATGITKYQNEENPVKTSGRKTWNLKPLRSSRVEMKPLEPLHSSTPFHVQKKSSPKKKTLLKPGGGAIKKISPKKKSPLRKLEKHVIKKTKMPNFKAIHQNALTKMENIVDMKERKAARAKVLLSGAKPASSPSIKNPGGKSRKALDYSKPNGASNALRPSPSNKKVLNPIPTPSIPNALQSTIVNPDLKPSPGNKKVANVPRQATPVALSKPVLRRVEQQMKVQAKIPQASKVQKNKTEIKKQVKSVATKTKTDRSGLEHRRVEIGNVRLNKRFELLMKMRMK